MVKTLGHEYMYHLSVKKMFFIYLRLSFDEYKSLSIKKDQRRKRLKSNIKIHYYKKHV